MMPTSIPTNQPVSIIEPANKPSERAQTLWALSAALMWAPVVLAEVAWAVIIAVGVESPTWWPNIAVAVVTFVSATAHITVVPRWRYRVHRWEISDNAVYTRTGWFDQRRRVAPLSRVQTVDTERGPLDRILGLATVTVTTASSAGAVEIAALDLAVAEHTVALLTDAAARMRGDAT